MLAEPSPSLVDTSMARAENLNCSACTHIDSSMELASGGHMSAPTDSRIRIPQRTCVDVARPAPTVLARGMCSSPAKGRVATVHSGGCGRGDASGGIVVPGMIDTHPAPVADRDFGYGADWTLTRTSSGTTSSTACSYGREI